MNYTRRVVLTAAFALIFFANTTYAQTTSSQTLKDLERSEIRDHKSSIEETQRKIEEVRKQVIERRNKLFSTFQEKRETIESKKENLRPLIKEEVASSTPQEKLRLQRIEALKIQKEAFRTLREEKKAQISESIQERILAQSTIVNEKFTRTLDKLSTYADTLEARISLVKEQGVDTHTIDQTLLEARNNLEEALLSVDTALLGLEALSVSSSPKETLLQVQNLLSDSKEKIRAAHQSLINVVEFLRELQGDISIEELEQVD